MGSNVSVNTQAHSITYVTDQLLQSLKLIITEIGLDKSKFVGQWPSYDLGISTWLKSGHLSALILEVTNSGTLVTRCDFTINYTYGTGDGSMWIDTDAIRNTISKFGAIPASCDYKVVATLNFGAPSVIGWGDTTLHSVSGFVKQSIGTTIGTHTIGAQTDYWRKAV